MIILILLFFFQDGHVTTTSDYFNIDEAITTYAAIYNSLNVTITKTVKHEDIEESKTYRPESWIEELKPFLNSNLNKAIYQNSYKVDSVKIGHQLFIVYRAMSKKNPTKTIFVHFENKHLVKIDIRNSRENLIYSTNEKLSFSPSHGYKLVVSQSYLGYWEFESSIQGHINF